MSITTLPEAYRLPGRIVIDLTPMQFLAVVGALRTVDDDLLTDEGVLPGLMPELQAAFDAMDDVAEEHFGEDWPVLTTTPERLAEEAAEQAGIEEDFEC